MESREGNRGRPMKAVFAMNASDPRPLSLLLLFELMQVLELLATISGNSDDLEATMEAAVAVVERVTFVFFASENYEPSFFLLHISAK